MENMNFIPANNLPVAEGDEVEVLCLENGEMKRKSASGLGGGNFIQINSTGGFDADGHGLPNVYEPITAEMFEAIVTGFESGHAFTIILCQIDHIPSIGDVVDVSNCDYSYSRYPDEMGLPISAAIQADAKDQTFYILDDGRVMSYAEFEEFMASVMPSQEGDGE